MDLPNRDIATAEAAALALAPLMLALKDHSAPRGKIALDLRPLFWHSMVTCGGKTGGLRPPM